MRNKQSLQIIFALVILLLVCACGEVQGKLLIMEGNSRSERGQYNEAIVSYMRALEYSEAEPYGEYGLGSVYFTMGEDKAALDRFTSAQQMLDKPPSNVNRELRYRIHYNIGVVLFSEGDYSSAADSFREALRIDGSKIEAKRNLELSLMSLERENQGSDGNNETNIDNESKSAFFDFIQQREINQWRNREWSEEEDITGPDY